MQRQNRRNITLSHTVEINRDRNEDERMQRKKQHMHVNSEIPALETTICMTMGTNKISRCYKPQQSIFGEARPFSKKIYLSVKDQHFMPQFQMINIKSKKEKIK